MGTLSIRLPEDLVEKLEKEARLLHKGRSELARDAIAEYVASKERERFMSGFLSEARAVYAYEDRRREATEVDAEFLPLDNEALDIAESADRRARKSTARGKKK